ncbi:MAG: acyl-[acyl-carrier-protein] thioesterase [bacterium]
MGKSLKRWQGRYPIHSYEIAPNGLVRMQSLCRFLQDAAGSHARELGVSVDQLLPKGLTWMLSRLRVKMQQLPAWGEILHIESWPADLQRLYAIRDFQISGTNEQKIGVATSAWLLIDISRKRPMRLPEDIRRFHPGEPVRALEMDMQKIPPVEKVDDEKSFHVRFSDLDLNRHVNYISYIEWALETVPEAWWQKRYLIDLELEYLAESIFGDTVVAQMQLPKADSGIMLHRLFRSGDDRELIRARTVWRGKQ